MRNHMLKTMAPVMLALVIVLAACSDDDSTADNGRVKIYLTDAPVDGANVDAVVLSVSRIEMKGSGYWKTVKQFDTPLSIDILDYQNGNAFLVSEETLKADTYTEARLVLNATEENGAPKANPDTYIRYADGTKKELFVPSGGQSGYKVKGTFTVAPNAVKSVILDFDARKSLVTTGSGANEKVLLKPTVRLIAQDDAALFEGKFDDFSAYSKVVIYAYEKGTFRASEASTPATGEARFKNALTSTKVSNTGAFTFAFMPSGEYDLVFAAHNTEGEFVDVIGKYENVKLSAGVRLELTISLSTLIQL